MQKFAGKEHLHPKQVQMYAVSGLLQKVICMLVDKQHATCLMSRVSHVKHEHTKEWNSDMIFI